MLCARVKFAVYLYELFVFVNLVIYFAVTTNAHLWQRRKSETPKALIHYLIVINLIIALSLDKKKGLGKYTPVALWEIR